MKITPSHRAFHKEMTVPGDKSISHRSIMFGALAEGDTRINGFLRSADCMSTMSCFRAMGIDIEENGTKVIVHGEGLKGLSAPEGTLDAGNSGTTVRLMSGILAAQTFDSVITGDVSIQKRPMKRVIEPLSLMGADIKSVNGNGCAPLAISGRSLKESDVVINVASAQVKSCVLLAALCSGVRASVTEPSLSRDHTERMLNAFGAEVSSAVKSDGSAVAEITPAGELRGMDINVPGDISSAAYFMAAALMVPGSEILIRNVGVNPTRDGIIRVLQMMNADIIIENEDDSMDPSADIRVRYTDLSADTDELVIGGSIIPTLIDELPVIAVIAAVRKGRTVIRDAAELRVKESDRISVMTENLKKMGVNIEGTEDGFVIEGGHPLRGAEVDSRGDHRIAMSMAVAALAADGDTVINGAECVNISYPGFFEDLLSLL